MKLPTASAYKCEQKALHVENETRLSRLCLGSSLHCISLCIVATKLTHGAHSQAHSFSPSLPSLSSARAQRCAAMADEGTAVPCGASCSWALRPRSPRRWTKQRSAFGCTVDAVTVAVDGPKASACRVRASVRASYTFITS